MRRFDGAIRPSDGVQGIVMYHDNTGQALNPVEYYWIDGTVTDYAENDINGEYSENQYEFVRGLAQMDCEPCEVTPCYHTGVEKCYSSRVVDGYIFDLDPSDAPLPAFTVDGSVVSGVTTPFVVEMQGVSTVTYNVDNGVTPADILAQVSSAGYTEVIFIAPDRIEVIHPTEQFVVVQVQGGTFVTSIGEERYVDVSGKATQYYQCGSDGLPDPATIQWRDSDTLESVSAADIVECEESKHVTHTFAWCDESDPENVVPKITRYFSDGSEDVIDPPAGAKNPCNC